MGAHTAVYIKRSTAELAYLRGNVDRVINNPARMTDEELENWLDARFEDSLDRFYIQTYWPEDKEEEIPYGLRSLLDRELF